MEVYGLKCVQYQLSETTALRVRYYLCEVDTPILSVSSMIKSGPSVILDETPHVQLHKQHACALHSVQGLKYIKPISRTKFDSTKKGLRNKLHPQLIAVATAHKDYWVLESGLTQAIRIHHH